MVTISFHHTQWFHSVPTCPALLASIVCQGVHFASYQGFSVHNYCSKVFLFSGANCLQVAILMYTMVPSTHAGCMKRKPLAPWVLKASIVGKASSLPNKTVKASYSTPKQLRMIDCPLKPALKNKLNERSVVEISIMRIVFCFVRIGLVPNSKNGNFFFSFWGLSLVTGVWIG